MRAPWDKPWHVEKVDPDIVERLASAHVPNKKAVAMGVDIMSDPHAENDEGYNWTLLSRARYVTDVVPGSAVIMGSGIGNRWLRQVRLRGRGALAPPGERGRTRPPGKTGTPARCGCYEPLPWRFLLGADTRK